MPTREQELYNLKRMQQSATRIKSLEQSIERLKKDNAFQSQRTVKDYPEYVSKEHVKKAESEIASAQKSRLKTIRWLLLIPSAIWGLYCCETLEATGENGFFAILIFALIYYIPLIFGPHTFYIAPIAVHGVLDLLFKLSGSEIYENLMATSLKILVAAIVLRIISLIPFKTISERKMLSDAKKNEEHDWNEYLKDKEINDKLIKEQREAIAIEAAQITARNDRKIKEFEQYILAEAAVLASIPGLADQDKNEYTINKIVTYFERGKADSIKEAINLFDAEELERTKQERERSWQISMYHEQLRAEQERKNLIAKQEEESKRRYDELKRIEKERNEKIDNFIDDLKRKLDE